MIIIVVFLINCSLYAQIKIDDSFESTTLENQMRIFRDSTNSLTLNDILNRKSTLPFIIAQNPSPSFGYDSSHFWIHLKIKNVTQSDKDFLLRFYRTAPEKAYFYLYKNGKVIESDQFNWKIPFYERTTQSKLTSTEFSLAPSTEYELYCLIQNKWNIANLGIEVYSKKEFLTTEYKENLRHGVLIGGVILAIMMALYLYKESSETIYLYYSFYSIFSALSTLGLDGVLTQVFGHRYVTFTGPQSYQLYIIGTIIFNILFTHKFLDINKKGPKWLVFIGQIAVFIFTIIAFLIIIESRLIANFRFIFLYIFYAPILILSLFIAFKRKEIMAKFYLLAFSPLNILMLLILASEAMLIKTSILLPYIGLGILFEIIILLLGLAYRLYDFQRKKQQIEAEMIFQIISAQETERQRIAQDLHDDVGNSLAALKNLIKQKLNDNEIEKKVSQIAQDVRNVSHNLASLNFYEITLSEAFKNLINRFNETETIRYDLIELGEVKNPKPNQSLTIYRIACELLNNIQKHSKATQATVQLIYEENLLTLMVEDNGIGISKSTKPKSGIGLKNIQSRVLYLNGHITLENDGRGTIIIVNIPLST